MDNGDNEGQVVQPQSVFNRLGPKILAMDMYDPPYVPQYVYKPHLPGMIFGCMNKRYVECMSRKLFGLPITNKSQVYLSFFVCKVRSENCSKLFYIEHMFNFCSLQGMFALV